MVTIRKGSVQRVVPEDGLLRWQQRGFVPWDDRTAGTEGEGGVPLSPTSDKADSGFPAAGEKLTAAQIRQLLTDHTVPFRAKDTKPVLIHRAVQAGLLPEDSAGIGAE